LDNYIRCPRNSARNSETGCCRAALAGLAVRDGVWVSADQGKAEADQAIELIRKSVGMGYRDADIFRTDIAPDPLRQRRDFKKRLAELETPSPTKPEKKP
jgi:hypothetical protein